MLSLRDRNSLRQLADSFLQQVESTFLLPVKLSLTWDQIFTRFQIWTLIRPKHDPEGLVVKPLRGCLSTWKGALSCWKITSDHSSLDTTICGKQLHRVPTQWCNFLFLHYSKDAFIIILLTRFSKTPLWLSHAPSTHLDKQSTFGNSRYGSCHIGDISQEAIGDYISSWSHLQGCN